MTRLVLLALSAALLTACAPDKKQETPTPEKATELTGIFQNTTKPVVMMTNGERDTIALAPDGSFAIPMNIDAPTNVLIYSGRQSFRVYAAPEQSVKVIKNWESEGYQPKFSGDLQGINGFLTQIQQGKSVFNYDKEKSMFNMEPENFAIAVNGMFGSFEKQLASFKKPEEKAIVDEIQHDLTYSRAGYFDDYSGAHGYLKDLDEVDLPASFATHTSTVPLEDETAIGNPAYLSYLKSKINAEHENLAESKYENMSDDKKYLAMDFDAMDNLLTNKAVKQYAQGAILNDQLSYTGPFGVEDKIDAFLADAPDSKWAEKIKKSNTEWQVIKPGSDAPSFAYSDIEGKSHQLSDMEGKLVYVDVWATWCGPCRAEIPSLQELENDYAGKPIEFVSISIDDLEDKEKWEKMVKDENLGGLQLLADNAWNSELCEDYKINSIPRFLLIDAKGKIITPQAPRPSSSQIRDLFEEQLGMLMANS